MSEYCVELEPIEDYFLGNERSFGFGRDNKAIYNNYYVISENLPTQTTLLGMMRYFVLKRMNLLNKDFSSKGLTSEQINRQEKFIGKSSFVMSSQDKLEYGVIKNIGPMFLKNKEKQILIKTPFNGVIDNVFKLRGLKNNDSKIEILDGDNKSNFRLIDKINLKEEDSYRDSFIVLDDQSIVKNDDIFISHVKVGINRSLDEENFFKKEYKFFEKYKLCFYVTLDNTELNLGNRITDVVYMGAEKSAFKLTMYQEKNDLENQIKNNLKINDNVYYALSDLGCKDVDKLNECCDLIMAETRNFRCLKTNYDQNNFYHKLEQSKLYSFIRAGSVFFVNKEKEEDFKQLFENENLKNIGFNQIVKLGGNN